MENLWKRKVVQEPICQICKKELENISHALLDCKLAKKMWRHTHIAAEVQNEARQYLLSMLQSLTKKLTTREIELASFVWWGVWNARNKVIYERKKPEVAISIAKVTAVMEAYQRVKELEQQQLKQSEPRETHQWEPPPEGWHKINVDATIDKNQQIAGLGIVIKDSYLKTIAATVRCIKFYGDTSFVEAEAAKWGLFIAQTARLSSVITESDCLEVVELINNRKSSRTEICWPISDKISSSM